MGFVPDGSAGFLWTGVRPPLLPPVSADCVLDQSNLCPPLLLALFSGRLLYQPQRRHSKSRPPYSIAVITSLASLPRSSLIIPIYAIITVRSLLPMGSVFQASVHSQVQHGICRVRCGRRRNWPMVHCDVSKVSGGLWASLSESPTPKIRFVTRQRNVGSPIGSSFGVAFHQAYCPMAGRRD